MFSLSIISIKHVSSKIKLFGKNEIMSNNLQNIIGDLEKVNLLELGNNEKFSNEILLNQFLQSSILVGINFVNLTFKNIYFTGSFFIKLFLKIADLVI